MDEHTIEIETRTCLFLASLYDDASRPGENLFEVNWNWKENYETNKPKGTKSTKSNRDSISKEPPIRRRSEVTIKDER
jgi:hypothetical protein